ncbi:hypothetical protein [Streptococcus infantis]|jgi:hypothetical protein|uniref:hypothetical protein n=1 Tax=Streptococcus infantis TaxID=68892 RepID=UPI00204F5869|nr:MAG TPA: hypothetical protein [Caudoviricetes sp.]DAQ38551.1 MAG TPA: hypothetical protein [Caudoviricetes sp.]
MNLEEALKQVSSWNLKKPAPLIPSEMTDEELSRLRFTWVSPEDEELVMNELKRRGLAL